MTGGLSWMTKLLLQQDRGERRVRFNPRPAGQVQTGSATDAVLQLMRTAPTRRWRRAQLIAITRRSDSAVDWALLYLREQGLICCNDGGVGGRQWVYWLAATVEAVPA